LRAWLLLLAMLAPCAALAQPAGCTAAAFGAGKLDLATGNEAVNMPAGVPLPARGIVFESTGFFINEGRSDWWVLDVDAARLSHVVLLGAQRPGASDEELARYRGYDALSLPHDWTQLRRDVRVSPEALGRIACAANVVWAYESPGAAAMRRMRESEAQSAAYEVAAKAWEREFRACRRRPGCAVRPPPQPVIVAPIDTDPGTWQGIQFHEATDVGESLWLLDGRERKTIGGLGVLAGDAEALRELLRAEFAAAQ
jgi:hypothetical protein